MLINIDYFAHGVGRFRQRYDHKTVVHQRVLVIVNVYTLRCGQVPGKAGIGAEQIMGADKQGYGGQPHNRTIDGTEHIVAGVCITGVNFADFSQAVGGTFYYRWL